MRILSRGWLFSAISVFTFGYWPNEDVPGIVAGQFFRSPMWGRF